MFGLGAAIGLGIGLVAAHELEIGKPPAVDKTPKTPWPAGLKPRRQGPILPDPPKVRGETIRLIPWGNDSTAHDWMSSASGPSAMTACGMAKMQLLDELEDICADNGFPGIESHDIETRDCSCMEAPSYGRCATRAVVTCAKRDSDIVGSGVAVSDSRSVAEASAEELARARCTLAKLVPAPTTTTCQCDIATGECACVVKNACD